jgi:zinc/manganese transport system permease protein
VALGAGIFALTRMRQQTIPQEAIIGIVYAIATAAAILVADRAPGGAEHIKQTLTGSILWITWPAIWKILAVYAVVAGFHWIFRKKFLLISEDYLQAIAKQGLWIKFWDFLFYITFGIVIVLSVRVAGIMLVFSFLVVPAAISMIFSNRWLIKLLIGWGVGLIASMIGLYVSYGHDFPSGPTIVCFLGLFLILSGLLKRLLSWHKNEVLSANVRVK